MERIHVTKPNGSSYSIEELFDKIIEDGGITIDYIARSQRHRFTEILSYVISNIPSNYKVKAKPGRYIYLNPLDKV